MAKLSQTFKIEGGSNTAPVSNNQPQKLSQSFRIEGDNSAPVSYGSGKLSQTFTIGQKSVLPDLQQSKPVTPIPNYDTNVIKEYESLPKTDIFSRLFSKESRDAYKRKQELNPLYEQNKDLQTKQLLSNLGISDNDIMRQSGNTRAEEKRITSLLNAKGITDKDTVDAIKGYSERLLNQKADKNLTEYADEHPVKGSALSIPFRMVAGVAGQAENAANYLSGNPLSNSQGALAFNNSVNNMRGAVADDMNGVGRFLYNSGMSMGDMLANRWMLGPLAPVGMGMEKATDTTNSAVNQGLTPNQIMLKNISSGVTTYLTEKFLTMPKLDAIKEMGFSALGKEGGKQIVLRALNAAGLAEGLQEGAEDVADWIADALIARGKNEFKQAYDAYKEQGLSDGKAVASVIGDKATELVMDMAGGYLSGFAGGGAEMTKAGVANNINNRNTNIPTLEQTSEATTPVEQSANAQQVDNSFNLNYNQSANVEKGAPYAGSEREEGIGNDGRGSGSIPSELPSGEQPRTDSLYRMGAEGSNPSTGSSSDTKQLGYNNRVFTEDTDVDPSVSSFDFRYSNNNVNDWRDNFEKAKASNDHGGAVDSHSAEELQKIVDEGGNLYMSGDKTVFGIVTPDGNLSGVCKADGSPHKMAATNVAKTGVKLGARKGDCFGRALVNMYAPAGFKPVGRCTYGYGFNDVMDKQVREQLKKGEISKEPDVYALVYDENIDKAKKYTQAELDALPLYEGDNAYNDMLAARDKLLNPGEEVTEKAAEPQKEYSAKKVEDKKLNKVINDLFNMFGKSETGKGIRAQLISSINEYEDTLSPEVYDRIYNLCEQGEKLMQGKEYVKVGEQGKRAGNMHPHVYPWFHSTITDEVMSYIDRVREMDNLLNKSNEAYRKNLNNMAETLSNANADRIAWAYLNEVKENFDEYVSTGDETFIDNAISSVEDMTKTAKINYSDIQKDFEQGMANAINENKRQSENKVMAEDIGLKKGARELPSLNKSTANETEVPLSEIPDPRNGATYTSKTAYTLRNSEVFNQSKKARALIEQQIKDGVFNVDRQTWLAAGTEAVEEIDEKGIDAVKEDILKKKTETTQTQIAESVYVVDNEIQKAIESGDASELARFTNGFNQRIHKVGQALQAMRMYGNTAAGMVLTTDTISNEETKKAMQTKKGKKRAKQNSKLAEAFKRMGYDGSMEKEKVDKTYNQILSEVKATIAREYASQDERFSDTDAEFLARMIFNGATTNEIIDALNRHYATGFFGMSSEDLEAINDLYKRADRASSSKEKAKLKADAAVIAAKYAGNTSFMDKMNAWRYLAMLGNPRTMIRNVFGNAIFGAVTDVKDAVGAVLESAVIKDGEKTKALINPKTDAELLKATRNDFDKTAYEEATQGGHKYDMKNDIRDSRRVFKTELIEKWRTGTNRVLEESDIKALKAKYAKALAGYLKANGYDASVLKTDNDILDRARAYAIEQAKIATFHSDNVIADILNDWSRATSDRGAVGKTIGAVLEAVMPFKKTPANILTQGVEYSPLGLLKLASQIHNQAGATAYIDTISKTLTGSGILLLGIALKSAGVLIGQKDDKEDPYGKGSNYALKIGDHTYTIDWMAPAALPLFAGAALYDVFNPNGEKGDVTLLDAISSIGEPVVEMSMLQGFNEMLTSFNSDKNKGAAFVANELTGYASQYIPTLAGQIARTIDPYRRSTRTNSSSYKHPFAAAFEKAGEKALNKIPGLSMTNQKYLDIWGNEQKNTGGNILGRAVQNFVSPGYWNDVSMTDREKKIADLQKTYDGSGSLIPSLAPSNKPDGSRMTNAEYEKWAKARGQELGKAIDAALKYKGSGTKTEDLQEYIHDIENFANAVAMNKQFKKPIAKTYEKAYEAYKLNGYAGVMEYYKMLNGADLDGNGSVTQEELAKYLRSSDIPRKQREDYFRIKFPKAKEIPTLR